MDAESKKESSARWKQVFVYVIAAAIATAILVLFGNVDRAVISDVGRTLVSMVAFLAAASIVMTSMYMGQVLREVPNMVNRLQPSFIQVLEQSIKKMDPEKLNPEDMEELSRARNPTEFGEKLVPVMVPVLVDAFRNWHQAFESFMIGPQAIRREGWRSLYFLVTSAFFSLLAILSGISFFLAASFALIIVSLWAIRQNWEIAEETIKATLWLSSLLTGIIDSAKDAGKSTSSK